MTQPNIFLSPIKPAIPAQGGAIDILVRVQGSEQTEGDKGKVTPKRLSLVDDRSVSMDGQPLHDALKCVQHIAGCMTPQDRISEVVYDDIVNVLKLLGKVISAWSSPVRLMPAKSLRSAHLIGGLGKVLWPACRPN